MDPLPIKKISLDTSNVIFESKQEPVSVPANPVPQTADTQVNTQNMQLKPVKKGKIGLVLLPILAVLLIIAGFAVYLGITVNGIYEKGKFLYASANTLKASAQSQDIGEIKSGVKEVGNNLDEFDKEFAKILWMKSFPWVGGYITDAKYGINAAKYTLAAANDTIVAVEPYMDILGYGKNTKSDGAKTAQERINFIVAAIPDLTPKIGAISENVNKAKAELDNIDADKYPEEFKGRKIRAPLKEGLALFDSAATLVAKAKPFVESLPYYIGIDSPRTYLLVFQNDKELRPTGGFLTAYAIVKVNKAKFESVSSSDIYNLDALYKPVIKAPDPVVKYLGGVYAVSPNLRLRDMNWSPDFSESMKLFTTESAKVGIKGIDGVIAIDTQVLVNILDVIGTIGVPGFGNFGTKVDSRCNCPSVIYELESLADIEGPVVWDPAGTGKIIYAPKNYDNRKKFIGPLMNSVLANVLGQPKDKIPSLAEAGIKSILEKHVLVYIYDEKAQAGARGFGIAGTIDNYDGDYLHINDANLGGRKSNLYVTQEVEQEITVKSDKSIEKTLTITYKNSQKQDGWLNSVLPNWTRIYVPKGSTLIEVTGFEDKAEPYEEFGKTVFAGFFKLRPEGVVKVTLKYKLPFKAGSSYKMMMQKQPGTDAPRYTITKGKTSEEFLLKSDKEVKL